MKKEISFEEELQVQQILDDIRKKAKSKTINGFTVKSLLNSWERFILIIKEGYDDSIYEYENDLSSRDLLQRIIDESTNPLHDKLIKIIGEMDEDFVKFTIKVNKPIVNIKEGKGWWWCRIPQKMGEELKNDLLFEGII